jgi:hypothetical protein
MDCLAYHIAIFFLKKKHFSVTEKTTEGVNEK